MGHPRAGTPDAERAAALSLGVTAALVVLKFGVWMATSSLAVLSQALDSVLDLVALGLVFFAIRVAGRPADQEHHYGHGKAENLAAFTQTLLIALVILAVVAEALRRLGGHPSEVSAPWYAIALLVVSATIDSGRVAYLVRTARRSSSEALKAGALNIASDVGTAVVALIALVMVRAGVENADAWGALLVGAVVTVFAFRLGHRSVDVLMDRAPLTPTEQIQAAAAGAPGVHQARRIRVRSSGGQLFADVTVSAGRTTSLERAHDIAEKVEQAIERELPGTDVVVLVEPETSTSGLVERVQAAASRTEDVHEVHNVLVHAFDEAGKPKLQVTLHAKVRPGMSLKEAHDLADRVEYAIEQELGTDVRVDTHMEPLLSTELGEDVTEARQDVVATVRAAAGEEPEVLDCHEVLITSTGSGMTVVAHVRGHASLPLDKMHAASTRIESAIHTQHDDVDAVLIHFEPA
ncbi:MAG: cation diffusion facilitator family transporter [Actinomycetota bacterium]